MNFESPRLKFRSVSETDYEFIEALMTDHRVMAFISGGKPRSPAQIQEVFNRCISLLKSDSDFCYVIATEKASNLPIGNLLIRRPATEVETPGLEIGYSFHPDFWRKGYASESVEALLKEAKLKYGSIRIVALINPSHAVSRRVLEKAGFLYHSDSNYVSPADGQMFISELYERYL